MQNPPIPCSFLCFGNIANVICEWHLDEVGEHSERLERGRVMVRGDGVSPRSIRVRGYYPHPTVDDSRGTLLELGRLADSKTASCWLGISEMSYNLQSSLWK